MIGILLLSERRLLFYLELLPAAGTSTFSKQGQCHYGSARETGFATRLRSRETRSKLEALVLQIYRPNAWHAKENVKPRPDWSPSVHDTIMARA